MVDKVLKTSVFVNETLFCDSAEVAIDADFTLPDYCGEISKIFKCKAEPRISSKGFDGKNVIIDGSVYITLLYADKDGCISSYDYQYPFNKSIETGIDCTGANLQTKIRMEYINCRAVTSRKVDIHGAAGMNVKVFKRKCTDIISDYDDDNVELRRGVAPATVPMAFAEKYLMIEEEIRIGQGQPPVKSILRFDAHSLVRETKIIKDKAVVKGEVTVNILYCPQEVGTAQCVKSVLPFSQIIDLQGVGEECSVETKSEIAYIDVKPKLSVSGENKCFSLTSKVLLTCEAYCSNDIAIVLDAFSRKYEADITRNKLNFEKITTNLGEVYQCKKNVELEEEITSVLDLWCNVQSVSTKFEDSNMVISSTLIAGMIVSNIEGNAIYSEKPIDFEYKYPVNCELGSPYAEPQIEVISCTYTITSSNNIEIRVELSINAAIYEKCEMSLISDVQVNTERLTERKQTHALVVYYCSEEDTVWDIARKYNSGVNEIMKVNNLLDDAVLNGKMLLIPMM